MKPLQLFLLFLLTVSAALAQEATRGSITLTVTDNQNKPLNAATAELRRAKDSQLVKTAVTDNNGLAEFFNIPVNNYFIKISALNCKPQNIPVQLTAAQTALTLPTVSLMPEPVKMATATVTARKPFIQKLTDRIVVNVESSILSAGSSAMEVLERSPGVNIDQNDIISLRGKQGVIIMIDGKPSPMTGADLANYLRGISSAAIERIDIITNPSAKYDAAGNAGIIDIRMKKDQRMGTNGTFSAGYGQGIYPKANTGVTFNHRNKKLNIFGNYNYAYRAGLNHLILDRRFFENKVYNGGDLKDNYGKSAVSNNAVRLGADFFPSKKTIIGVVASGNFSYLKRTGDNFSTVIAPSYLPESTFESLASNNDHNNNFLFNLNFKHNFKAGREFTADADYGEYRSSSITSNATRYYKLDGTRLQPDYVLDGDQQGRLTFKTARADYVHPLKKEGKWEAGVKGSYVTSDNDAQFFDVSTGTPQNDVTKTNHFLYKESNLAGYVNFSKQFKKFDFQLGLRAERTDINTRQFIGNVTYDSGYLQWFPSAFFNYHLKENKTLGVSVSRRIDRPGYSQLNPFLFLIDVTTYATGRPGLRPQLSWSYELSYTVNNMSFAFGYSRTKDLHNIILARFSEVFPYTPSPENVTVQIPFNFRASDYFGLTATVPVRINKWWNMMNNAEFFYQKFI
ncbi:MAG: TonB-dependent receptor, partial [Dinghuibacter sp.]|nr:TonB-dependent receptor [Dinghuibacter sp.]